MAQGSRNTPAKVTQAPQNGPAPTQELVLSDEARARFASMAMMIPTEDGNGAERILLAILNAQSWDELDDPWDNSKALEYIDVEQRIDSVTRRPSAFTSGLGIFLVVHGHRMDTDEDIVWTTGSVSTVAQLTGAYVMDALPLYGILRKAERPTERGYYPYHLEFFGAGDKPTVKAEVIQD